ncbi:MAG: flagellar basal body rod protein [Alkaliphilus sp.]|nr:flagellar hook-basal body protein [bacterium AH-315-L21]MBN4062568.1 flagellar hook-basal body protein [Alkaliphilus sp. AH-315-G20]MBN4074565.1 flagellar hook-basal body protein [bacterium AH-315-E09]PHS35378.1 MAG: flagellar basal body rod protein [Alkaliphilus sp.]
MLRGLYTAVSAMKTSEKKIDIVTNNIANVNTTSFKKNMVITETFPEILLSKINGEILAAPFTNRPLTIIQENNVFHLSGDIGFFAVDSPMGKSFSRDIRFTVADDGYLKTFSKNVDREVNATTGNYVLDSNGQRVFVGEELFQINESGQVVSNGQVISSLINRGTRNTIGTINSGQRLNRILTDFSQGTIEQTGNSLDFAITGSGFFKVLTPHGEMYTRNGNFTLNNNAEIITTEGYFLAGKYGSIISDGANFQLSEDGRIIVGGEAIDQIEIVNIENVQDLRKQGEGYFRIEENVELQLGEFTGNITQGALESSNVNTIKEMVELINIHRTFESNQKVVRAYDEMLQKAVNDIGRI